MVTWLLVVLMAGPSAVVAPWRRERDVGAAFGRPIVSTTELPARGPDRRGPDAAPTPCDVSLDAASRDGVPTAEAFMLVGEAPGRRAVDVLILIFVPAFTSAVGPSRMKSAAYFDGRQAGFVSKKGGQDSG